jgi:hypothetical protein
MLTFIESFISSNEGSNDLKDTGDEIRPLDLVEVCSISARRWISWVFQFFEILYQFAQI